MDQLRIPFLSSLNAESAFDTVDEKLNQLDKNQLEHLLWSTNNYKPLVYFTIAHSGQCIFLRYTVYENNIRVVYNKINDPVYKDTCVEFFIGIENDSSYYNLEFNCAGTCTAGYGNGKHHRKILPAGALKKIRTQTKLYRTDGKYAYRWDLTLMIPVTVFIHHADVSLSGLTCRTNFYKCGDDLPQPHFLAYNNIHLKEPNFHLPEFFGDTLFLDR